MLFVMNMILVLSFIFAILELGLGAETKLTEQTKEKKEIPPIEDDVKKYGCDVETHIVTTEDGYKLTIHRLVVVDKSVLAVREETRLAAEAEAKAKEQQEAKQNGSDTTTESKGEQGGSGIKHDSKGPQASSGAKLDAHGTQGKQEANTHTKGTKTPPPNLKGDRGVPILIAGEILLTSSTLLATPNNIVYSLAEQGFDVWCYNYRGNVYSREHTSLSTQQSEYWNFSLHELGTKDLPAVINHILTNTKRRKLIYMGFSMGTTIFFIMASSLPAEQTKVAAMVAVCPVARPAHMMVVSSSLVQYFFNKLLQKVWNNNQYEGLVYNSNFTKNLSGICTAIGSFCSFLERVKTVQQHGEKIDKIFKKIPYAPAGASTRVLQHYLQIINAKKFQQFQYDTNNENKKAYNGSKNPPKYDLDKINLPIIFVQSPRDPVAESKDIEWLTKQITAKPRLETLPDLRHIDLILNQDNRPGLNDKLMSIVQECATTHKYSLAQSESGSVKKH